MSAKNRTVKPDKRILMTWFAVAVIPLIVHIVVNNNILKEYTWFSSNETNVDFFLVCKMYALIAVMAVMIILAASDIYSGRNISELRNKFKSAKLIFVSAGLYVLLAIISGIFAHDVRSAFFGGYAQYEPVFVLMAYIVIFLFTYCYMNSSETMMLFYRFLIAGIAAISFIGVMQAVGMDFFGSGIGKKLITMFSDIDADRVSLKFEAGRVYMTLYNPNYVGSYVVLVLPVVTSGLVIFNKAWQKAASVAVALMLVICLVGSWSTTGITAAIISAVIYFAVMIAASSFGYKKIITAAAVTFLIAAAVVFVNFDRVKEAVSKYSMAEDNFDINKMELVGNGVVIDYRGESVRMECSYAADDSVLTVYDGNDAAFTLVTCDDNGGMAIEGDDFYSALVFGQVRLNDDTRGFYVRCSDKTFVFTNDNDEGKYMYYNPYGKKVGDIVNSRGALFDNYESFASARGFIWSRTIPLLGAHLIAGCGSDNFVYEFPNNDYLSLINNGYYGEVVTRPHNMYLQTGVQTGALSLVLFILIYMIYFIQSIRIYSKKSESKALWIMGVSIMAGTSGYMICGFANDSTVCVAPVFWGMLGMGYACNYLMKGRL